MADEDEQAQNAQGAGKTADDEPSVRERKAARRRAARLAAVQALYQLEASGRGSQSVIKEFLEHRFGADQQGEEFFDADETLFSAIVTGVAANQKSIDAALGKHITDSWTLPRLDSVVRALLRAAGFELLERGSQPPGGVIADYMAVCDAFYEGEREPRFVNGVLDAVARAAAEEAHQAALAAVLGRPTAGS